MIEQFQPITNKDVGLVKRILEYHDEAVIAIGDATSSNTRGRIMTAGERIEVTDFALQAEGIDPKRYILIPVENTPENDQWVAEVMMLSPRFDTIYTRNSANVVMFRDQVKLFGYSVVDLAEARKEIDYFQKFSAMLKGGVFGYMAARNIQKDIPESAMAKMVDLGIDQKVDVYYNMRKDSREPRYAKKALFLGGLQPMHGVYLEGTGHIGAIKKGLAAKKQVIIAIGSAQESDTVNDPLTAGQRIEVVRYALQANGVDASQFYIIPIKDIHSNPGYPSKLVSMLPDFDTVIAGNDWTKRLFQREHSKYGLIPLDRRDNISGTDVRNIVYNGLRKNERIDTIEQQLSGMVDLATLHILRDIGFYDTMKFLSSARE